MNNFEPTFLPVEGKRVISSITVSNKWLMKHERIVAMLEQEPFLAKSIYKFEYALSEQINHGYYLERNAYEKLKIKVSALLSDQSLPHTLDPAG